jgi:hypothetical protein
MSQRSGGYLRFAFCSRIEAITRKVGRRDWSRTSGSVISGSGFGSFASEIEYPFFTEIRQQRAESGPLETGSQALDGPRHPALFREKLGFVVFVFASRGKTIIAAKEGKKKE